MQKQLESGHDGQLHEVIYGSVPTSGARIDEDLDIPEVPEEYRVSYYGISEEEFIKNGGSFAPRATRRD